MTFQTLKLADEFFASVDNGTKRGTVRAGVRDIALGELVLQSATDPKVTRTVHVACVTHTTTARLTNEHAALDGYSDVSELWRVLRQFYPNLAGTDAVTVIEFASRQWQPIETAPRDGTVIELTWMESGQPQEIWPMQWGHVQRNGVFAPGVVGMWVSPDGSITWTEHDPDGAPTHWRPKP